MIFQQPLPQQLQSEIERVGGGYLRIELFDSQADCQLFVHEGTELDVAARGSVAWHPWDGGKFAARDLLEVLKGWPSYQGHALDERVGIWFEKYRRQRNRKTGAIRWKDLGMGDGAYPQILPWDDLERLEDQTQPAE